MKIKTNKAVIYCRVSDQNQVKNGHGLSSQETRCREFARYSNLDVVAVYHEEGISGSLILRPAMQNMLEYLRDNPGTIVIIDDISRLARGLEAHIQLRTAISESGGILKSPSIEFGEDSDSQLVENLLASVSQHHRQKNAEQVKNRMRARMLNGYWLMKAPVGYKMQKVDGHGKMLVKDEPVCDAVRDALEGYAYGRFDSPVEIQQFLQYQTCFPKNKQGKVHIQRVLDLLNRMVYTGYYEYPEWDISLMQGKHEPIIAFQTFMKVQEKFHGNLKAPAAPGLEDDFPLRGFILCDCCGSPMTACWSKGKTRKYPYYLCRQDGCELKGKSIRADQAEEDFAKLLSKLCPKEGTIDLMLELIEKVKKERLGNRKIIISELQRERIAAERKIDTLVDRIVGCTSATLIETYERQIAQLERNRVEIDEKIKEAEHYSSYSKKLNRTFLEYLENPRKYWDSYGSTGKKTVLKATFSQPLKYSKKEGYRTPAIALPFSVMGDLSGKNSVLVEPRRFELLTSSLPAKRSTN